MHLDDSIEIPPNKPYGLTINMGGDDVSVVAIVYRKNWDCVNSDRVQQIKIDIYLKTISCFSKKPDNIWRIEKICHHPPKPKEP
jgi:hypothetical protein